MKNPAITDIASGVRKGLGIGLGLVVTAASVSMALAAYATLTATTGETLSKDKWNEMLQFTVPPGAVMAFNLTTCPTNWSPADGAGGRPDLRGQFIRGLNSFDNGATTRSDGKQDTDARTLGAWQADAFQGHKHSIAGLQNAVLWGGTTHWNDAPWYSDSWSTQLIGNPISDGTNGNPRTGTETRPKNVAFIYCIKN